MRRGLVLRRLSVIIVVLLVLGGVPAFGAPVAAHGRAMPSPALPAQDTLAVGLRSGGAPDAFDVAEASSTCVTSRISASADDAEERNDTGAVDLDGDTSTHSLQTFRTYGGGSSGTLNWWGLRFLSVDVPQGATITSATVTFRANATTSSSTDSGMTLWGQLATSPTTFTTGTNNITSRTRTSSSVTWTIAPWTSGSDYSTPSLATIVQEIVGQSGWAANNAMVIIGQTTVSQNRSAISRDATNGSTLAPILEVCYTQEPTGPTIYTSGTLTAFSTQPGVPSAEKSYTVSGSGLTENIAITAPADFEISTTGGSGFGSSLTLTPSSGSVAATPIYVRFNRTTEGTSSGDIVHTSSGATTVNVAVSGTAAPPGAGWIAYNDCVYKSGEDGYIGANVTTFGVGSGFTGDTSGVLLDQATGDPTGVTASLTQSGGVTWQSGSQYGGADTAAGTDANETFGGLTDMIGTLQYGSTAGWYVDLTFTGLDSAAQYTFATSSSRNNSSYTARYTQYTLSSVDDATNASTAGVNEISNLSVWYNTGDNHADGYVARWTGIQPGADGTFTVRAEAHSSADANKAYAFDVFMLQEITGEAGPTIRTSGTLAPFSAPPGLPSDAQTYTVSGTTLTDDIEIAAPAGFEISDDGTNYFPSLTLIQTDGVVESTPIYVRLYSASEGDYSGDITHQSPDATTRNVHVSGTVSLCDDVSLVAAEDTYLSSVNQSNNYGGVDLFKVSSNSSTNRGALLRWDLSSIPSDATVSSASLTLYVSTAASQTYNLYNMRRSWVEGTTSPGASSTTSANWTTYNGTNTWGTNGAANTTSDRFDTNLWAAGSTTFGSTGSKTVALNASGIAAVQGWISDAAGNYGVTIQNYSGSTSSNDLQISSSENATVANRPKLNITYCASSTSPTISTAGTLSAFSSAPGVPSAVQSYTVAGSNLGAAIDITAPADFQISLASGSGFGSALSLTPSDGSVPATTVYVRFNRATAGSSSGSIVHTSEGAATRNIAVSGTAANQAPAAPGLVAPADGGTSETTAPELQVSVTDPESDAMSVSFYGREAGATGECEEFTVIGIPDTQNAAQSYPAVFDSETQWIVDHKAAENIAFVTHLGDIVNTASSATQWQNADASMDILDAGNVYYSVGPGNHDLNGLYETYFGISRFSGKPWYGGYYGSDNANNYSLFSESGMDFIVINLQYSPTTAQLDWADGLLKANSTRRGIVASHNILNIDNSWQYQTTYTALKDNPNLFLMLCGHMHSVSDGSAYRAETGDAGQTIHVLLTDYQDYANGGNGYLRLLRFAPSEDKIYAKIYSPYLDAYLTNASNYEQFEMVYDMECSGSSGDYSLIGTVSNVASGTNASITWPDRVAGTEYDWYVTVSDGGAATTGAVWSFTAGGLPPEQLDFGDAPDASYATLAASNGARHVITAGLHLGLAVDAETDGQPGAEAQGDDNAGTTPDDEDGVMFSGTLVAGSTVGADVTASAAGVLNAWVDWNRDGDWADAGEQIAADQTLATGTTRLTVPVPSAASAGYTYARFRFGTTTGLSYTGLAPDGEVEDYWLNIEAAPVQYDLVVSTEGDGSVTLNPAGGKYNSATTVTLTPVPGSGQMFDGWSGANATDIVYAGGVYTIVMDGDKAVTAQFVAPSALLGGVDGDGQVNSTDALIVLSCDAGLDTSQFCPMDCGDVNGDGFIDSTDALIVLSYDVGISVPYAVGGGVCPTNVAPCQGCNP